MTDDRVALQTLLEKIPDANYLREMSGFADRELHRRIPWQAFARTPGACDFSRAQYLARASGVATKLETAI
jgi:hypothetical protein